MVIILIVDDQNNFIIRGRKLEEVKKEEIIYGPKIQEKLGNSLLNIPGYGRKAIDREGNIDKTPIFDVSMWPQSCK